MNIYESDARRAKIAAICSVIDKLARDTNVAASSIPEWLRRLPVESGASDSSWSTLAVLAGVRMPSETTRAAIVELYEAATEEEEI